MKPEHILVSCRNIGIALFITAFMMIITASIFYKISEFTDLLIFGFSMIVAHVFISPIAHEPIVFFYTKTLTPGLIAITGGLCCCLAGAIDYLALPRLINHPVFRSQFETRPIYLKLQNFFSKSPFWVMTLASFTPLPQYPFKFLSIAGHYPLRKYTLAQLAGRAPRFYLLALFGHAVQLPPAVIVVLLVLPLLLFTIQLINPKRRVK